MATSESGGDADDMSFDPASRSIYVACGDGAITVVRQTDADHYRKLPDVPTRDGARNSLFVDSLKALFVVLPPAANERTELRVFQVSGRVSAPE